MALAKNSHPDNRPGEFFVDTSCIDCDLCRQIAPTTFASAGDQSVVIHQPETGQQTFDALKALVTCPTASIGTISRLSAARAVLAYPEQVEENVHFCGFAAESSFGASSYLIVRPQGNILIDSPRFASPLVRKIETMGGIRWIFLTHRDDIADHEQWSSHFAAKRIMHRDDAGRLLQKLEYPVSGDEAIPLNSELLIIPTPGHTKGHMVLLYRNRFLFTGDHLWWSDTYRSLHASWNVCWYSYPEQLLSVEKLRKYEFEWVLPGHGRPAHFPTDMMKQHLETCISRMKSKLQ